MDQHVYWIRFSDEKLVMQDKEKGFDFRELEELKPSISNLKEFTFAFTYTRTIKKSSKLVQGEKGIEAKNTREAIKAFDEYMKKRLLRERSQTTNYQYTIK